MQPTLRAKSVTQEALSLLEAYLDLDDEAEDQVDSELPHISNRSFPRGKNIHSFDRATHGDPNKLKNRLKKYSLRDPWVQITNPCNESAKNQCSLCSRDVHHDTPRSDLSVSCSPTLALNANQRCSPAVGYFPDRPCSPTQQVQTDVHRDLVDRILVSSLASGPSSPLDAPLMPLFHISPTGSEVDRVDGLVDRFQRQQSAFSTSSSIEPHSSLTSDPISRTPSHVRSGSLLHSNLPQVDTQQTPVHRSQSVGNAVAHHKVVLLPADPTVNVTNANATRSREPYFRGVSVHSAPGEARYKVPAKHSQSRTGPNRWYRISLPKITRVTKMSNQPKPSRVLPGLPAAWSSHVVPDSTSLPRDSSPSRPKPSRTSRGARDTFAQLFPRRLRSGQDGLLSGPYLTGGVGLFLRKPMFAVFRRKKRSGRQSEQTEIDSQFSLGTAEAHLSSSGDRVREPLPTTGDHTALSRDEHYASGPWTAVFGPGGDCTSASHSPNTVQNKFSSTTSPSTKLENHEVTRVYKELIQKAEGDRLSSSAAEVWRDINVLPNPSGNENMTGATRRPNESEVTEQLTRPHRPDYLRSHDVILLPDGAKTSRTGTHLFYSNLPPIHANLQTLASINSGSSYDSLGKLSDSVSPVAVGSEKTNCAHTTQLPDAVGTGCSVEPTVPYTIVANMINVLSQRIMNQISEDELERRLRLWEERAAAVYCLPNVVDTRKTVRLRKSGVVEPIVSSNGIHDRTRDHSGSLHLGSTDISAVDSDLVRIKTSDLKHSLLAQARRLEHRKKLDICTDLLDHLVSHTNYPAFEADLLKLLGRQPNWHQISVLYYLSRCAVRHLLTAHFHKLDSLNQTVADLSRTGRSAVDSQPSTGSSVTVDVIESARLTALTEMGLCRASVERIKDFTVTFFLRWYADWVYQRGGWQSVIEDTEDSELD